MTAWTQGNCEEVDDPPGCDFFQKRNTFVDGAKLRFEIYHARNREEYMDRHCAFLANPGFWDCQIFVYSITDRRSFKRMKIWLAHAQKTFENIPEEWENNKFGAIVGNKCDREEERQVSTEEGHEYAKQFSNMLFYETSATQNTNIEELFVACARMQMQRFVDRFPELLEIGEPQPEVVGKCNCVLL